MTVRADVASALRHPVSLSARHGDFLGYLSIRMSTYLGASSRDRACDPPDFQSDRVHVLALELWSLTQADGCGVLELRWQ